MFKLKKRKSETYELLDKMWDSMNTTNVKQDTTWKDYINICSSEKTKDYIKKWSLQKFLFETKYVFQKPNRETMDYLWGEHAFLYHVFGCKTHKFVGKTYDDYDRYIEQLTVFCPECNKEIFKNEELETEYISLLDGKLCSNEEWEYFIKTAKIHRKFARKDYFKYRIQKLKNWNYIKYKINLFIIDLRKGKIA